jgi:hypothetical protein
MGGRRNTIGMLARMNTSNNDGNAKEGLKFDTK